MSGSFVINGHLRSTALRITLFCQKVKTNWATDQLTCASTPHAPADGPTDSNIDMPWTPPFPTSHRSGNTTLSKSMTPHVFQPCRSRDPNITTRHSNGPRRYSILL